MVDFEELFSHDLDWGSFRGKNVVITGMTGMIGGYMARAFLRLGAHVIVDGRSDYIFHAASPSSPKRYMKEQVETLMCGTHYTERLLREAQFFNSKMLYVSSGEAAMDISGARGVYSEAKRAGEAYCNAYYRQYGVQAKIVRPCHTYGPGIRLDDGRIFSDFVSDIIAGRDITVKGDGSAVRSYCYLADAALAFFMVLLNGKSEIAYELWNPECVVSTLELATRLGNMYGLGVKVLGGEPDKLIRRDVDISPLTELGWKPWTSIEEGFGRTVDSVQTMLSVG